MRSISLAGAVALVMTAGSMGVPANAAETTPAVAAATPVVISPERAATPTAAAPAEVVAPAAATAAHQSTAKAAAEGAAPASSGAAEKPAEAKPAEAAAARIEDKPAPPPVTLRVDVNLSTQRLTVYENGAAIHSWPISSGRAGYPTVTGNFSPIWMSKMHYSRKYDNAPMPHAVFFHGGFAIHATYATGMLGRPASHGCVRLSPSNAKTFYHLVGKHGRAQTRIAVHGSPKFSAPQVARTRNRPVRQPSYAAFDWGFGGSSYDSNEAKPVRRARVSRGYAPSAPRPPKIVYRNGQPFVYVGPQTSRKYWQKNRYSGSYASY